MRHEPLTETAIAGPALVAATENARRLRRAFLASEKLVALAEAGPEVQAADIPRLIAEGTLDPDAPLPEPRNARRLRERMEQVRTAMILANDAEDSARQAAAQEIADRLRRTEFGKLQAKVARLTGEAAQAQQDVLSFARGLDPSVQSELLGYRIG